MRHLYKVSTIVATLALIAGLSFSSSYAQATHQAMKDSTQAAKTYTVSGKVVNAQNHAVADAKITILSGSVTLQAKSSSSDSKIAKTDKKGQFKVENVSSGTYTVKVKASGYKTAREQVTITENKSLTIKLEPSE